MSRELGYFPPGKYTNNGWHAKSLNYSPWYKLVLDEWPARVSLTVDLLQGKYLWGVEVTNWEHDWFRYVGVQKTAEEACEKAEQVGALIKDNMLPEHVVQALKNGWRPPMRVFRYGEPIRSVVTVVWHNQCLTAKQGVRLTHRFRDA